MGKGNKIKLEYIVGIIIPIVIIGLIIFVVNRSNDNYQSSNLKDDQYKNDTKGNNENQLLKTSSVESGIQEKAISNQIIGEWSQSDDTLLMIYKTDDKYLLGEINSDGGRNNYELIEKHVQGNQVFIIKELLEGTNVPSDVKLVNEYTDYYQIENNGDLSLYDKDGLIENYKRVLDASNFDNSKENLDNNSPKTTSAEIILIDKENSTHSQQIIGEWDQSNNSIVMIYKTDDKYFILETNRQSYGKGHELIVKNINGTQAFIIKALLNPSNVKPVNEYTDYYAIENNGDLSLYDKDGLIERYRKIK